ncbi:MAG: hypothetical protein H0U59_02685 [Gemmatimonadaceae bacterium]|nr:hypothetical protein [Gemmatimonadaceae bacterium]
MLEYPEAARYYARIFESDWASAFTDLPDLEGEPETLDSGTVGAGRFIEVSLGDYTEV